MTDQKSLKQKNLEFFKKEGAALHDILVNHKPASKLVFGDDGEPDILVDGKRLYGGKASEFAAGKIDAFRDSPYIYSMVPPKLGKLDRYGNQFLTKINDRAQKDDIHFAEELPPGESFFLIIFGIGLGKHIDALVDSMDPYFVIFVEPDLDHFVHSVEVYPWHVFFEKLEKKGGKSAFAVTNEPEKIANLIQQLFRQISPAAVDGTPIFVHTESETAKATIGLLEQGVPQVTRRMGFLFDETLMMKNTHLNLRSGTDTMFVRTDGIDIETPVFVIGAGPSLDQDMDFIKGNADKAIIISTGTALRSMLVNGITPDFHMEIENVHIYSSITEMAENFDLSSVCLVAPGSVEPHITEYFKDIVYFFRQGQSPYPLFCVNDLHSLRESGPAVINASLSFAIDIGAKSIYLFGTDFGTRGDGPDKAKDNVLYTEGAVLDLPREFNIPVAGNFGGAFFTSDDFFQALKAAGEMVIPQEGSRKLVNCSDGALFSRAEPVRSATLSFSSTPESKKADLQTIRNRFTTMSRTWFDQCWNETKLKAGINELADSLAGLFDGEAAFEREKFMVRYTVGLRNPMLKRDLGGLKRGDAEFVKGAMAIMVRGTIDTMLMCIKSMLRLVPDPAELRRFQDIVSEEFSSIVDVMRKDILAVFDDPKDIPLPKTDPEWKKDDVMAEQDYTWGQVSRNAPCPCGSGRRYKHCHGKSA